MDGSGISYYLCVLAIIKHVVDDKFLFQRQSAPAHGARNTVRRLQRETLINFIMVALWKRADHYIFILWFLSIFYLLLFSSPNLSRRRMDVYHTSHTVWP